MRLSKPLLLMLPVLDGDDDDDDYEDDNYDVVLQVSAKLPQPA